MNNNKISIIMGIYNCASTLPEAIESIINQTYTNWELIMCDDCSTDDTYEIAKQYQEKIPDKIVLIKNDKNMKLSYTLNHCLEYATGKYIARMDGDDLSVDTRFEEEIKYLMEHEDVDLVGTAIQRFNDNGNGDIIYAIEFPDKYTLKDRNPFLHATILCKKEVYEKLGGYTVSERTVRAQDYDLWFRFYNAGFTGVNLQKPLYLMREDKAAIRRRTVKARFNSLKTTFIGYNMLGYPKRWLIKPILSTFFKAFTPYLLVDMYRKFQMKNK